MLLLLWISNIFLCSNNFIRVSLKPAKLNAARYVCKNYSINLCLKFTLKRSRDSVDGIVTRLRAGWSWVRIPAILRHFSSPKRPGWLWGAPSPTFSGYQGPFPGIKRLGREFDLSLPSTAQVKNEWRYRSIPLYTFVAWTATNIPFTLYLR
jgi:hypothetical protein